MRLIDLVKEFLKEREVKYWCDDGYGGFTYLDITYESQTGVVVGASMEVAARSVAFYLGNYPEDSRWEWPRSAVLRSCDPSFLTNLGIWLDRVECKAKELGCVNI